MLWGASGPLMYFLCRLRLENSLSIPTKNILIWIIMRNHKLTRLSLLPSGQQLWAAARHARGGGSGVEACGQWCGHGGAIPPRRYEARCAAPLMGTHPPSVLLFCILTILVLVYILSFFSFNTDLWMIWFFFVFFFFEGFI